MVLLSNFLRESPTIDLPDVHGTIICGPPRSGKTSIAFQYAITEALQGRDILFCCNQELLQAKMPKPQTLLQDLTGDVLKRINFVYTDNPSSLCEIAGSIGTLSSPVPHIPSVIVVDDDGIIDKETPGEMRSISAILASLASLSVSSGTLSIVKRVSFVYVSNTLLSNIWISASYPVAAAMIAHNPLLICRIETRMCEEQGEISEAIFSVVQHGKPLNICSFGNDNFSGSCKFLFKWEPDAMTPISSFIRVL
eukprot:Tbor_TRINITY_DN4795_c0_g1::TRINITY_DN4795_c0_g1_i1::g.16965::m.16965